MLGTTSKLPCHIQSRLEVPMPGKTLFRSRWSSAGFAIALLIAFSTVAVSQEQKQERPKNLRDLFDQPSAESPVVAKPVVPTFRTEPDNSAIRHALTQKTAIDVEELPLSDFVELLSQKHKIPIRLDKKALDDAGIGSDSP